MRIATRSILHYGPLTLITYSLLFNLFQKLLYRLKTVPKNLPNPNLPPSPEIWKSPCLRNQLICANSTYPLPNISFLFFFFIIYRKLLIEFLQRISIVYKDVVSLHARPFLVEPFIYEADGEFRKFLLTKRNSNPLPSCDY